MKKILVVGYGSIGKRHAGVLSEMGHSVSLVTRQVVQNYLYYESVEQALLSDKFDYVVIASPTSFHVETLSVLINFQFRGKILVEKPLFDKQYDFEIENNQPIYVGYNLRFNETLFFLKQLLSDEQLISFSVRVGQYLPTWRINTDYRENYSAHKKLGGGVLRDLSHELDYSTWICGDCVEITALGGHFSDLEIDSDDIYSILMRCQHCPIVTLHMDYLSQFNRREVYVQTKKHTYFADLINNVLLIDEKKMTFKHINTYAKQHEAILKNDIRQLCNFHQGAKIVKLIDIIETANESRKWICL
jgi:predicted dehydrogenase